MQTPRAPLLRLGRQLSGHEVRIPPFLILKPSAYNSSPTSSFLTSPLLPRLSRTNPQVSIHISPRPHKHPVLRAHYINGREKAICVRNLEKEQILQKCELLVQSLGGKNRKIRGRNVLSENEGVRGIWSPFHGGIKSV